MIMLVSKSSFDCIIIYKDNMVTNLYWVKISMHYIFSLLKNPMK